MKKSCFVLTTVILGWSVLWLPGSPTAQSHAQHGAAAASALPCHVPPQVTEAAEHRLGGDMYKAPEAEQHSGQTPSTPAAQGAHMMHTSLRGGTFYMAPNKMHHIEAVYTEECGFQLFLYNAFTESIHIDRFQAFVHVFPQRDDEFDIIRFLSPAHRGTVLAATFADAVSRPFDVELHVRFPDSDEPQVFNIAVPAAEAPEAATSDVVLSQAWARPIMSGRPSAGYLTIANHGANADRLLAAASPAFKSVELHLTRKKGDMTMMHPVDDIVLPANATVELAPGGFHMMLFGAREKFKPDDSFPLALTFEKAGKIEVQVQVTDHGSQHAGHSSN